MWFLLQRGRVPMSWLLSSKESDGIVLKKISFGLGSSGHSPVIASRRWSKGKHHIFHQNSVTQRWIAWQCRFSARSMVKVWLANVAEKDRLYKWNPEQKIQISRWRECLPGSGEQASDSKCVGSWAQAQLQTPCNILCGSSFHKCRPRDQHSNFGLTLFTLTCWDHLRPNTQETWESWEGVKMLWDS